MFKVKIFSSKPLTVLFIYSAADLEISLTASPLTLNSLMDLVNNASDVAEQLNAIFNDEEA